MKLLIVGAGFVGERVGKAAKENGFQVQVASRTHEKMEHYLSWADDVFVWNYKLPSNIDAVLLSVAPREGANYRDTYLKNAQAVKEAPYIVYTSSTSVYGDYQGQTVNELTPPLPQNENQRVLLETEGVFDPRRTCIFRLGEITGKTTKLPAVYPGTGENYCNFSPIDLIVDQTLKALENKITGLFNLVSKDHPTRKEYILNLAHKLSLPPPIFNPNLSSSHTGNKLVTTLYKTFNI
jgi:nucleoside-diphosphate-sugar epimerase